LLLIIKIEDDNIYINNMLTKREFATAIDVYDPIAICIGNYLDNVQKKLDSIYVGVIFDEFLIKSTSIVQVSQPVYNRALDGSAQISVRFYATGIFLTQGDVIVDTVIKDNAAQHLTLNNDYVVGIIKANVLFKTFKVGDLLPVTVQSVTALPFRENINIMCIPYYFTKKSISVRETTSISKVNFDEILVNVNKYKNEINKYDKDKINQLSRLIQYGMNPGDNSISDYKQLPQNSLVLSLNIENILTQQKDIENSVISSFMVNNKLEFIILKSDVKDDVRLPVLTSEACIEEMFNIYSKYLQVLNGLLEIFNKPGMDINKGIKLWYLYYNIASKVNK